MTQITQSGGRMTVNRDVLKRLLVDFRENKKARLNVGILPGSAGRYQFTDRAITGINRVIAKFGQHRYKVNIRVPTPEKTSDQSNADIGAEHEFGVVTKKLPARSWLRMPIIQALPAAMLRVQSGIFGLLLVEHGIVGALSFIGVYAKDVIGLAFDTGGYGAWQKLSPDTIEKKGHDIILVETTQLRNAVNVEVVIP